MPLAYYAREARQAFWEEHWAGHDTAEAVRQAQASPLTTMIAEALPARGRVVEAGCGLGQYVILMDRAGRPVVGVDWSLRGLGHLRAAAPSARVAAMELTRLGFRSSSFDAYVSLGVVEHDPAGPEAIVAEARRVLAPRGVLLVSVPYVNGLRRLGGWWIRRRNRGLACRGGSFYQYAFGRGEFHARLARLGFRVVSARPYDPARVLRRWRRRLGGAASPPRPDESPPAASPARSRITPALPAAEPGRRDAPLWRRLGRALLYTPPALALLGHMVLFVAIREDGA